MPVRPFLRLSWLTLRARLRSAGYIPWLLLVGWLLISAYQEPRFLRRYGLFLVEDAQWSGALIVMMVLVGGGLVSFWGRSRFSRRGL